MQFAQQLKEMYSEQILALPHALELYTLLPGLLMQMKAEEAQPQRVLSQKKENICENWNQQCKIISSR
jgi:hypothetical protein